MEARAARRRLAGDAAAPDALFLLEHDPVVTVGRGGHAANLLVPAETLESRGVAVRECGRGGDVTWHGPGQLVGYPVLLLEPARRDAHRFLRDLEEVLILALGDLGLAAGRVEGKTGVWVEDRKIASIGVRFSSWVTSHGFALNVHGPLDGFGAIVPCGLQGVRMTSIEKERERAGRAGASPLSEAAEAVAARFGEVFGRTMTHPAAGSPDSLASAGRCAA
jgi:lipoate-protein ligase B